MAAVSLGAVMILGISGAIAALGDTLFPARSLAEAWVRDFDPAASIFVRLRILHPAIAILAGAWLGVYAVSTAGRRRDLRPRAWLLLGMVAVALESAVAVGSAAAWSWTSMFSTTLSNSRPTSAIFVSPSRRTTVSPNGWKPCSRACIAYVPGDRSLN